MKHYVGLDVSQNEVSICVVNMEGLVVANEAPQCRKRETNDGIYVRTDFR